MFDELTLEELESRQDELYEKWMANKQLVTTKLFDYLDEINEGAPLKVFRRVGSVVDINDYDRWKYRNNPNYKWSLHINIEFPDPENPYKSDFGSDFYLYASNIALSINHGSCGTWDKSDLGQYSRLTLMLEMFKHQDDIIEMLDQLIDLDLKQELENVSTEVTNRHDKIRWEEEERMNNEILAKAIPGKYFAEIGYHWHDTDDGGCVRVPHFYNIEKILKVTPKCFTTEDTMYYITDRHRRDKNTYINRVKRGRLFIIDDPEQIPTQEEIDKINKR